MSFCLTGWGSLGGIFSPACRTTLGEGVGRAEWTVSQKLQVSPWGQQLQQSPQWEAIQCWSLGIPGLGVPPRVEVSKQKLSNQLLGKTNIPEECGTFPISWCKYFPQALVRLLKRCYWEEYTQHLSVAENPAQDALDLDWGLHIIRLLRLPSGHMVPHLSREARTEK